MKKNYKKDRRSIIKTLSEMSKLKKEVNLTIEIKMCQMKIEKKRNMRRIITIKEKHCQIIQLIVLKNQKMLVLINKFLNF